jgi:hypothetical protein
MELTMNNNRLKKIFFLMLIINIYFHSYGQNNTDLNNIIHKIFPKELYTLKILEEKNLNLDLYTKNFPGDGEWLHEADLKSFRAQVFKSFIEGDFNNNGKKDIVISCIEPSFKKSYIVIVEEEQKNKYLFIKYFKFNHPLTFIIAKIFDQKGEAIQVNQKDGILFGFPAEFDSGGLIKWNGRRYIIEPRDPFGP